jgi:hypothetical protein
MSKWKDIIIEYAFSAGVGIVVGLVIIAAESFQVQTLQLLASSAAIGIVIGFFCRTGSVIILNKLGKKPIWAFLAISLISGLCTIIIFYASWKYWSCPWHMQATVTGKPSICSLRKRKKSSCPLSGNELHLAWLNPHLTTIIMRDTQ